MCDVCEVVQKCWWAVDTWQQQLKFASSRMEDHVTLWAV